MQAVIKSVGWGLHAVLGTTVCESIHAATTLFLGMVTENIYIFFHLI